MKKVAVSGGFDPLHHGHVRMFEEAKRLGDYLIVILNGDSWLMRKKGFVFMPAVHRAAIIGALGCVDEVYIHDSEEDDVCQALDKLNVDIFANGGDRKSDNTPEVKYCDNKGIQLAFNVGGGKIESSSEMVARACAQMEVEDRPWGNFVVHDEDEGWALKTLELYPGQMTSLQTHSKRTEHWVLVEGSATVSTGEMEWPLTPFNAVRIAKGAAHRLIGGPEGAIVVEVIEGEYDEEDIVRLQDKYGRA